MDCFLGRPLPGPGLLVMGLRAGSDFRTGSTGGGGFAGSVLFCDLLNPWKCCLFHMVIARFDDILRNSYKVDHQDERDGENAASSG